MAGQSSSQIVHCTVLFDFVRYSLSDSTARSRRPFALHEEVRSQES